LPRCIYKNKKAVGHMLVIGYTSQR
jgi:hypothetical protein